MVTTAREAHEKARQWAAEHAPASGGEVGLYEFDGGYVAWPVPPPDPGRSGPPTFVGAPRLVIAKDTGELSIWPSLSVEAVAERFQQERRAERRFSAEIRHVLTAAGWRPDRDVSSWVDQWFTEVTEQDRAAWRKLPLFPVARAALAEFGGLRIIALSPAHDTNRDSRIELWPTDRPVPIDLCAEFAATTDTAVFPLAWHHNGPSHTVVDETGRAFLLHPDGVFRVADSVDEAITAFVRSPDLIGSVATKVEQASRTGEGRAKK